MYDSFQLPADTGLTMLVNTAVPGSSSAAGLTLLANWAATLEQPSGRPRLNGRPDPG